MPTKSHDLSADDRKKIDDSKYAFPDERKEPLEDASHVRNAIARFDQVTGVTAAERELAFANIKKAAQHYKVDMSESKPEELGTRPSTGRTAADRKKSARKAAATRKRKATGGATKASTTKKVTRKKATRKRSG